MIHLKTGVIYGVLVLVLALIGAMLFANLGPSEVQAQCSMSDMSDCSMTHGSDATTTSSKNTSSDKKKAGTVINGKVTAVDKTHRTVTLKLDSVKPGNVDKLLAGISVGNSIAVTIAADGTGKFSLAGQSSAVCPVMGSKISDITKAAGKSVYKGKTYYFCCGGCKPAFDKNPEKYVKQKQTAA